MLKVYCRIKKEKLEETAQTLTNTLQYKDLPEELQSIYTKDDFDSDKKLKGEKLFSEIGFKLIKKIEFSNSKNLETYDKNNYGVVNCDSNINLVSKILDSLFEYDFDHLIILGDIAAHKLTNEQKKLRLKNLIIFLIIK